MKAEQLLKTLKHTALPIPKVAKTGKDFLRLMQAREPLVVVSRDKFDKAMRNRNAGKMELDAGNTFILFDEAGKGAS